MNNFSYNKRQYEYELSKQSDSVYKLIDDFERNKKKHKGDMKWKSDEVLAILNHIYECRVLMSDKLFADTMKAKLVELEKGPFRKSRISKRDDIISKLRKRYPVLR